MQVDQTAEASQTAEAQAALHDELTRMLTEVKRKLKGESKNELIRIVGALLLDNYALKMQLQEALAAAQSEEKNETTGS